MQTWLAGGSHCIIVAYLYSPRVSYNAHTAALQVGIFDRDRMEGLRRILRYPEEWQKYEQTATAWPATVFAIDLIVSSKRVNFNRRRCFCGIVSACFGMLAEARVCGCVYKFPSSPGGLAARSSRAPAARPVESGRTSCDTFTSPELRSGSSACEQARRISSGLCWFNPEHCLRSLGGLGACSVKAQRVAEHEKVFLGPGASCCLPPPPPPLEPGTTNTEIGLISPHIRELHVRKSPHSSANF